MKLETKARETAEFIAGELVRYKKPVLFCSFGKDSTVLLHLLRSNDWSLPIVFFQDPWFPRKYIWARELIAEWDLEVYDYPPLKVSMAYGNGLAAFNNEYQCSSLPNFIQVPKNIIEFEDDQDPDDYLCGVRFFTRPVGSFAFPWDVALIGHKSCDEDQICGPIPLESKLLYRDIGPDFLYPLRDWSHDDIWDYIEDFGVPYQKDRYDLKNRREWSDKTFNSDYWHACTRCVDKRRAGQVVYCPKMEKEIFNMSHLVGESKLNYAEIVKNGT